MRRPVVALALVLVASSLRAADEDDPVIRGKPLTEWLKVLHDDPDPKKRQIALLLIGQVGTKSRLVLPALLTEFKSNSVPEVRARCPNLMLKFKGDERKLIEPLAAALKDDKEGRVREAAATALGKLEREAFPTVGALTNALSDADPGTRGAAAEALSGFGVIDPVIIKDSLPALIGALKDKEAAVRIAVVHAIGRLGANADSAVPGLTAMLETETDLAAKKEAAKTLAAIGPHAAGAASVLAKMLKDPATDLRQQAALSLSRIGPAADVALPALLAALKDKDKAVRCHVIHAIGSLGKSGLPAIPEFLRLLKDDEVVEVRVAIIEELGGFGPAAKDALDALQICAKDGRPAIREAAAEALKRVQSMP